SGRGPENRRAGNWAAMTPPGGGDAVGVTVEGEVGDGAVEPDDRHPAGGAAVARSRAHVHFSTTSIEKLDFKSTRSDPVPPFTGAGCRSFRQTRLSAPAAPRLRGPGRGTPRAAPTPPPTAAPTPWPATGRSRARGSRAAAPGTPPSTAGCRAGVRPASRRTRRPP